MFEERENKAELRNKLLATTRMNLTGDGMCSNRVFWLRWLVDRSTASATDSVLSVTVDKTSFLRGAMVKPISVRVWIPQLERLKTAEVKAEGKSRVKLKPSQKKKAGNRLQAVSAR